MFGRIVKKILKFKQAIVIDFDPLQASSSTKMHDLHINFILTGCYPRFSLVGIVYWIMWYVYKQSKIDVSYNHYMSAQYEIRNMKISHNRPPKMLSLGGHLQCWVKMLPIMSIW